MNGVKSGFTTLNRLLGKKNKESSLSKSSSNLSRSMSQLPTTTSSHTYINNNNNNNNNNNSNNNNANGDNKILPLQSMSNAPFEQTFRITVQLPRDQLYVARLGAKTPLHVLLTMVCNDKQLDVTKYEFRHPSDMSQVYDNDCTIGFVGLNELKLVLKTEKYQNANSNNFNSDEIYKLRNGSGHGIGGGINHTNGSNNSTKTSLVSPYSSTNSLNSIDSSGMMSTSSRGGSVVGVHPPIPPSRKKRAAPRPPSQNSIPENKDVNFNNSNNNNNLNNNNISNNIKEFKSPLPPTTEHTMPIKKAFHVSSPNLVSNFSISTNNTNEANIKDVYDDTSTNNTNKHDYNHNINTNGQDNRYNSASDLRRVEPTKSHHQQRPMSMHIPYQTSTSNRSSVSSNVSMNDNSTIVNHSRTSSDSSEQYMRDGDKPEPTPRRRLFSGSKKKAPPAPQPRGLPPVPTPRLLHSSKEKLNTIETNHNNGFVKNSDRDEKDDLVDSNETRANEKILPVIVDDEKSNDPIIENSKVSATIEGNINESLLEENTKPSDIINTGERKDSLPVENRPTSTDVVEIKEQIATKGQQPIIPNDDHCLLNTVNVSKVMLNVEQKQQIDEPNVNKSNIKSTPLSNSSSRNSSISISVNTINTERNQNSIETNSVISTDSDDFSINENTKPKIESSDDDIDNDKMKIYNLKLGKSITKTSQDDGLETRVLKTVEHEDINPEVASIRSQSPLWTYTLPAPANFADPSDISSTAVMDNSTIIRDDLSSMPDNQTIISDSTTINSDLIDEIIKPIIHEKTIVVESDEIVRNNSDIEDGYHGGDLEKSRKLSESLKKNIQNETIENRKNHVIEELNNVINDNTLEKLISRPLSSPDNGGIVNSNLTNFKMSTYQPTANEEVVQIKRNSITKSISRSDSFHSTRIEAAVKVTELSLPRSSSYLSLNETATVRRKSSGSLHESPSLQSLEVMKMILPGLNSANSSKRNSINVNEDEELLKTTTKRSSISDEIVSSPLKRNSREEDKIEQKRDSIKENVTEQSITTISLTEEPKPVVEAVDKIVIKQASATEEVEDTSNKKWKYQGPPAINLSSWAERPKIQVAIKSDRDYKFGGGGHSVNNRNSDDSGTLVDHNNIRNENERKLPIVRGVEYKKPVVIPLNQETEELKSVPPVILRPKPEITNKPNFYQTFSRPNTIHINGNYNNSTTTNKFTPFVRGFKTETLNNNNNNSNTVSIESIVNIPKKSKENVDLPNKTVNSSTTITKINHNSNSSIGGNTLPFGQNTLRRTGLKDKILFTENTVKSTSNEMPAQQIHLKQQETIVKSTTTVVNSNNDIIVNNGNSHNFNNHNSNSKPFAVNRSNSSRNSNITVVPPAATAAPPPPPIPKLAPVVRSAVIKKSNSVIDIDPRDQLLNAIKSFNRDSLKRS